MKEAIRLTIFLTAISAHLFGQTKDRIFYASFCPQDWDIYLSRDAGKTFQKFTEHPSLDYDAAISPDGKWVVFTSERSGIPKLYAQSIDGSGEPQMLLSSSSFQDQAAFSPDGNQLAFVATHEGNAEIYVMPFRPDTVQEISAATNVTHHSGGDFRPAFSPDGKQLAFCSDREHPIVPHPQFPFARQRTGDVFVMDADGGKVKRLTNAGAWDGSPEWSLDGSKLYFYSERNGQPAIFEMNKDGSNQQQIIKHAGPAVSPKLLSDGVFAFTTWTSEQDFKIMRFDASSNDVMPLVENGPDVMFHADHHPNGLMVFHGGKYAANNTPQGNFGFDGDVLSKLPDSLLLAGKAVNIYGVRRPFMAPPMPGTTNLVYDASDRRSMTDGLKPLGYGVFWLPLFVGVLFLTGLFLGIFNRKLIPFWKYLLFGLMTIVFGIATGGIFLYVDAINPYPLSTIRLVMGILTVFLLVSGWWFYKRKVRQQENNQPVYRISTLYSALFWGLAVFSLLCTAFINNMVHTELAFYQVNYQTGERTPLFTFDKETDTNPANFNVLDSKVAHDGKALIFTTGSFRGRAKTQGDIWRYDFETKKTSKLANSPYNDGFADISRDGKMVFRSGRSGHFDIYLQNGSSLINLTNDDHRDNFPAISANGDKIVFSSDRLQVGKEYKTMDIFLMKLQPDNSWSEPELISTGDGQKAHAHFSPDGEWVVYTTEAFGINDEQPLVQPIIFSPQMYGEMVAYNTNTKERIRLTHNKWEDGTPLWVD